MNGAAILCTLVIKKSIRTKAFRGKLENNDPEEESAVSLLKEVLKEKTCNQ